VRFSVGAGEIFVFAGVRSREGCAMFTTEANAVVRPKDRMPVIFDGDEEAAWLDGGVDAEAAAEMLDSYRRTG